MRRNALCLVALIGLAACGKESSSPTTPTTTVTTVSVSITAPTDMLKIGGSVVFTASATTVGRDDKDDHAGVDFEQSRCGDGGRLRDGARDRVGPGDDHDRVRQPASHTDRSASCPTTWVPGRVSIRSRRARTAATSRRYGMVYGSAGRERHAPDDDADADA